MYSYSIATYTSIAIPKKYKILLGYVPCSIKSLAFVPGYFNSISNIATRLEINHQILLKGNMLDNTRITLTIIGPTYFQKVTLDFCDGKY